MTKGLKLSSSFIEQVDNLQIQKHLSGLILDDAALRKIMASLLKCMERGLEDESSSCVRMLPSYVRAVPNGTETGKFLALDLGGTNFRVLLIRLDGAKADMRSKIFRVPQHIMTGSGQQLFDHIASCMASFMAEEGISKHERLPLGFTFSFPCSQTSLVNGKLIKWTKGFCCSDVENVDVVKALQKACHRRDDVEIDVVALLNDTVGTLMSCAHSENTCNIGVIVGTGSNACYLEKIANIPKIRDSSLLVPDPDDDPKDPREMIINTEWGGFGDTGELDFIRTAFDLDVDKNSINPGKQIFEKMISGMYMGELVRLCLEKLTKDGLLFHGQGSETLFTCGKFPTKFVSEIEADALETDRTYSSTMNILEDLELEHISPTDCANVAYICSLVSTRAAYLSAAGVAVLLNRMGKPFVTVGIDGSVYRFHPTFKTHLEDKIRTLINPDLDLKQMLSEDGSGRGAALVAAVASRLDRERASRKASRHASMEDLASHALTDNTTLMQAVEAVMENGPPA